MKGSNDGYEKKTQEPPKPEGLKWAEEIRSDAPASRFRDRDLAAYEAFGTQWRDGAVQRYILTGEISAEAERCDREIVEALGVFCDTSAAWRPIGAVAADYLAFLDGLAESRDAALFKGCDLGEVVDYQTGEVSYVEAEQDLGRVSTGAAECPYPGVIRGGLADRAVQRIRAPVNLPYREKA